MTVGTPHFTLAEFTRSDTAARLRIDNTLPAALVPNAQRTFQLMEAIRAYLSQLAGREIPITVTSGYRCLALNTAIGSSRTSDHVIGAAADWRAPDFGSPYEVCRALAPQVGVLGIGQLIAEFIDQHDDGAGWTHVSWRMPDKLINRIISIGPAGTRAGIVWV